jgi:hypothetical protein
MGPDRFKNLNLCSNRHRNVSPLRATSLLRLRAALLSENYVELLAMRDPTNLGMPPEAQAARMGQPEAVEFTRGTRIAARR